MIQRLILRPPQPIVAISPLLELAKEHAVNVIYIEGKGKEKVMELEVMPIKRARIITRANGQLDSMLMNEKGTSNQVENLKGEKKRKKRISTRRKITIKYFPLGSNAEPYDPIKDVSSQGPKLTWP